MTLTTPPMTALSFVLDDRSGVETADALGRTLHQHAVTGVALRAVRRLASSVAETVDQEFGAVAATMLELDLGDVLVSGWRKHADLTESARRTFDVPGSEEVHALASHRIASTYHPNVDLYMDDLLVNSFEFELHIVFDLTALAAVVRAGDLVSIRGGDCTADVTLRLEGAHLAHRRHRLDLGLVVPLRHPIPLVDKAALAPPVTHPSQLPRQRRQQQETN